MEPVSSGRKEAGRKFPISQGMVCEWKGLANAGGGAVPIVGCPGYPATDIHHGPDKNTLHNTPDNVHRICAHCHNRWHGANDRFYGERPRFPNGKVDGSVPFLPEGAWKSHDPVTKATNEELFAVELERKKDAEKHGRPED